MKTILCFGDSNTYGYQPETKKRYDETTRWTCLLQQAIQPYGWRVVEEGLCGRTTNLNGIRRENRNGAAVLPISSKKQGNILLNDELKYLENLSHLWYNRR